MQARLQTAWALYNKAAALPGGVEKRALLNRVRCSIKRVEHEIDFSRLETEAISIAPVSDLDIQEATTMWSFVNLVKRVAHVRDDRREGDTTPVIEELETV